MKKNIIASFGTIIAFACILLVVYVTGNNIKGIGERVCMALLETTMSETATLVVMELYTNYICTALIIGFIATGFAIHGAILLIKGLGKKEETSTEEARRNNFKIYDIEEEKKEQESTTVSKSVGGI